MDQARILQTDVDKCAKVDNVENGPLQLNTRLKIFELEKTTLEDRLG